MEYVGVVSKELMPSKHRKLSAKLRALHRIKGKNREGNHDYFSFQLYASLVIHRVYTLHIQAWIFFYALISQLLKLFV